MEELSVKSHSVALNALRVGKAIRNILYAPDEFIYLNSKDQLCDQNGTCLGDNYWSSQERLPEDWTILDVVMPDLQLNPMEIDEEVNRDSLEHYTNDLVFKPLLPIAIEWFTSLQSKEKERILSDYFGENFTKTLIVDETDIFDIWSNTLSSSDELVFISETENDFRVVNSLDAEKFRNELEKQTNIKWYVSAAKFIITAEVKVRTLSIKSDESVLFNDGEKIYDIWSVNKDGKYINSYHTFSDCKKESCQVDAIYYKNLSTGVLRTFYKRKSGPKKG